MYSEIVTALSGLKTMSDLTKLVLSAKVDSAVTEKATESQTAIISLQCAMLELQSQYQLLSVENEELKKQLIESERWETERQNYTLAEICVGVFVYSSNGNDTAPSHWLCANCFQNKQKSLLQLDEKSIDGTSYLCPRCKTIIHDPSNCYPLSFAATRTPQPTGF